MAQAAQKANTNVHHKLLSVQKIATMEFNVPIVILKEDFTATALNLTDKISINYMSLVKYNSKIIQKTRKYLIHSMYS